MEPTQLISDDLLNSTPLEHHGTKGMKWGIWNAETRAKYLGGMGRKLSSGVKKRAASAKNAVSAFADKKVSEVKASHAAKKQAKADAKAEAKAEQQAVKQQRKELGMSKVKYDQLRETTLSSHDPKVVAKGMHTLTDAELDKKLDRLKKEDQIARLSSDQALRKHQANKARNEAIRANPAYVLGTDVAGKALKKLSKGLLDPGEKGKGKGKDNDKDKSKDDTDTSSNSEDKKTVKVKKVKKTSDASTSESVRSAIKVVENEYVSSTRAKSAASRGERMLSDGTLRAEIIDVQPVSYSSERQQRKALPSGKE